MKLPFLLDMHVHFDFSNYTIVLLPFEWNGIQSLSLYMPVTRATIVKFWGQNDITIIEHRIEMIGQSIWLAVISNGTKSFCRCHGKRFTLNSQLFCSSHKCVRTPSNSHTLERCVSVKQEVVCSHFLFV